MKNKILVVLLMVFIGTLTACDFLKPNSTTTALVVDQVVGLEIFKDELSWTSVTGASGYIVYVDDVEVANVSASNYTFTDVASRDQMISVKAYASSKSGPIVYSVMSEETVRYTQVYTNEQILTYDFSDQEPNINDSYTIPSYIRMVYIIGDSEVTYTNVSFVIDNRSVPLEISLENANLVAPNNQSVIYTEGTLGEEGPIVTVSSMGTSNSLTGGNNTVNGEDGKDGTTYGAVGGDGYDGAIGYSAIHISNLYITGEANITLKGGKGSDGGDGGDGHKLLIYTNFGGDGGKGGTGGYGAECIKMYVDLPDRSVILIGGDGGNGGSCGNSVITHSPSDGADGPTGAKYSGEVEVVSGVIQ